MLETATMAQKQVAPTYAGNLNEVADRIESSHSELEELITRLRAKLDEHIPAESQDTPIGRTVEPSCHPLQRLLAVDERLRVSVQALAREISRF